MMVEKMVNYFDKGLSISLSVPDGWTMGEHAAFDLHLAAPAEMEYHANLGFSRVVGIGPLDAARFEQIVENTKSDQRRDFEEFKLLSERRLMIDGFPTYVEQYEWVDGRSPNGRFFSQILTLIAVGPNALLEIHGASLKELEGAYIPLFIEMVESIRFIPADE